MQETIKILERLIEIDSQYTKSNEEIIDFIKSTLYKFEIKEHRFKKDGLDLFNLVIKIPGESSNFPLIFVGHTDTVPVNPNWTKDPFKPIIENGRIYGLGASDMKSGLACIISAALSISTKPKNDIYLLLDADEEGSGLGGKELIKSLNILNSKVIVAEPTNNQIIYAQKGCFDLKITLKGESIHSSRADSKYNKSKNANYLALTLLNELIKYGEEIEKKEEELLGKPTLNIGRIYGGTSPNVVSGKCSIEISRRLISSENLQEEYELLSKRITDLFPNSEITSLFEGDSFTTNPDSEFISKVSRIIVDKNDELGLGVKSSWTEASLFSKMGEVIIFGPGIEEMSHRADEYAEVDNILKFKEIYQEIMENI